MHSHSYSLIRAPSEKLPMLWVSPSVSGDTVIAAEAELLSASRLFGW